MIQKPYLPNWVYWTAIHKVALCLVVVFASGLSGQDDQSDSLSASQSDADRFLKAMESKVEQVIDKSARSVVAIARVERQSNQRQQAFQFQLGFPNTIPRIVSPEDPDFVPSGFGTGLVWDSDGTIVTAYHVLDDPRKNDYFVWYMDRPYPAKVIATPAEVRAGDPYSDLAVLKINAVGIPPMEFAEPAELTKGQLVVHLGNPYAIARDGKVSATWGLISNLKRPVTADLQAAKDASLEKGSLHHYGTLIETDAQLELGSSGGALINLDGKCIGMTVSYAAIDGYERQGGFAIPIDDSFRRVVDTLKQGKQPTFGFLGIQPENLLASDRSRGVLGARVSAVVRGMPGDLAGLREGDIVSEVNGVLIENRDGLFRELSRHHPESQIALTVLRRTNVGNRIDTLKLNAKLSKKFIATNRPAYSSESESLWRGLQVEYATALPSEMLRFSSRGILNATTSPLAVLNVEPNTQAWNAGIRPGYSIIEVDGRVISNPDDFSQYVRSRESQVVRLKIIGYGDQAEEVEIPAERIVVPLP